jgi:hypothetical protein
MLVHVWGTCTNVVFTFYHHFLKLLPTFLEFWAIYKARDTPYMFERHAQKLIIFEFYCCFCELLPTVCGSSTIYKPHDSWYMFERHDQKLIVFTFYWCFHKPFGHSFGVLVRFYKAHDTRYTFERMTKNSTFWIFYGPFCYLLPIVLGFQDDLHGPRYSGRCLKDKYKKTLFSHFIIVFLSYCPLFWSFAVIYKAHDTRCMLEMHDQKLIIFCVF